MLSGQHFHPLGNKKFHLGNGKFIQHLAHDVVHILLLELLAVHREHGGFVFFLHGGLQGLCLIRIWLGAIQQNDKWFSDGLQLLDGPFLRRHIIFPGQVADAAVRRDHQTDGCMVVDDLLGPDGRRLCKRDLVLKPGRLHLAFRVVLNVPGSPLHHEAHAVDEPDFHLHILRELDRRRVLGDKFRLCGHDRGAGCRLGQLILRTFPAVFIGHVGKDQQIHKPFDKG